VTDWARQFHAEIWFIGGGYRGGHWGRGAHPVDALLGQLRDMATDAHVRVATHPVSADAADAITGVALQEGADLIVVGTRSDRGTRQLSAAPKAVIGQRRLRCPRRVAAGRGG
jgi:nucleotide-binding universal stress UspA family protein